LGQLALYYLPVNVGLLDDATLLGFRTVFPPQIRLGRRPFQTIVPTHFPFAMVLHDVTRDVQPGIDSTPRRDHQFLRRCAADPIV
jgi:hypothetical protein